MHDGLINLVNDRLEEVMSTQQFDDPSNPGSMRLISRHAYDLPLKRTADEGQYCPFTLVRPFVGSDLMSSSTIDLILIGRIWTNGEPSDGWSDIVKLCEICRSIQETVDFTDVDNDIFFRLKLPIKYTYGVNELGEQPHPNYQFVMRMSFSGNPLATNTYKK